MARGLKKGMTNNPNGKPKGSKNKLSGKIKQMIQGYLEDNFDSFVSDFSEIKDPALKCKIYLDAAKFIIPKPKELENSKEFINEIDFIERLFPLKED